MQPLERLLLLHASSLRPQNGSKSARFNAASGEMLRVKFVYKRAIESLIESL
jgi:hypothetical protein